MVLLLACTPPPPCEAPEADHWSPILTEIPVLGTWAAEAPAAVDTPCAGCVEVEGGATYTFAANRGVVHQLRGRSSEAAILVYGELSFEVEGEFDLEFTPLADAPEAELRFDGSTAITGFELTRSDWAEVDDGAPGTLHLGVLIHIEAQPSFVNDEAAWSRKARVIRALADVFAEHGAVLTVQADSTFVRGAAAWDPALVDRPGLDWSIHIHPDEDGSDLESQTREARVALDELGFWVTDLNGGFGLGRWDLVADLGLRSTTAFKDADTQSGLPLLTTRPWRLAPDASNADVEGFMENDATGPLIYLPGSNTSEIDHTRFTTHAQRVLTQARAHTTAGLYDTWYFVLHVDDFGPTDPDALDVWLDTELANTVAAYDDLLTAIDPTMTYAGASAMAESWLAQECE